jgi:hypothetical protein
MDGEAAPKLEKGLGEGQKTEKEQEPFQIYLV